MPALKSHDNCLAGWRKWGGEGWRRGGDVATPHDLVEERAVRGRPEREGGRGDGTRGRRPHGARREGRSGGARRQRPTRTRRGVRWKNARVAAVGSARSEGRSGGTRGLRPTGARGEGRGPRSTDRVSPRSRAARGPTSRRRHPADVAGEPEGASVLALALPSKEQRAAPVVAVDRAVLVEVHAAAARDHPAARALARLHLPEQGARPHVAARQGVEGGDERDAVVEVQPREDGVDAGSGIEKRSAPVAGSSRRAASTRAG
jgi:hypothetical protein